MPSSRTPTLREVALTARTSPATVDRVLNKRGGVSGKRDCKFFCVNGGEAAANRGTMRCEDALPDYMAGSLSTLR